MRKLFTISLGDYEYFMVTTYNEVENISLQLLPSDKLDDKKTVGKIKREILYDIEFNKDVHPDENTLLANKVCERLLKQKDILEGIENIYFDGELDDIKTFLENNPKLKDYKKTIYPGERYNYDNAKKIKEKLNFDNIYLKLPYVSGGFNSEEPIRLDRYMLNTFIFNKMFFDIEKMNLSPLESLLYLYQMINLKELECNKKIECGDEVVNKSLSLSSINDLFYSCIEKLGLRNKCLSGRINNNYIDTLYFGIYINDKKYNVDGIYYFSPILEKLYNGGKVNKSFKYFARKASSLNENIPSLNVVSNCVVDIETLDKFIDAYKDAEVVTDVEEDLYFTLNSTSNLIDGKRLLETHCNKRNRCVTAYLHEEKVDAKKAISIVESFKSKIDDEIDDTKFICLLDSVLDACDKQSGTKTGLFDLVKMVEVSERNFDYDLRLKRTIDFEKRLAKEIDSFFGMSEEDEEEEK